MVKDTKGGKAAAAGAEVEERADQAPGGGDAQLEPGQEGGGEEAVRYDLSEDAHLASIEAGEAAAAAVEFDARSLVWDARDAMLECYKHRPRPYAGLSQGEQRDVAASFEQAAQEIVRRIVEAVAANGQTPVRVLLTKVTLGEDIVISGKVKTFSEEEEDVAVGLLHSARGKHVMLTVASKDDYQQGQRSVDGEPDQTAMEFEAGAPPADDSDLAGEGEEDGEGDDEV